jgi:hypothetical protein
MVITIDDIINAINDHDKLAILLSLPYTEYNLSKAITPVSKIRKLVRNVDNYSLIVNFLKRTNLMKYYINHTCKIDSCNNAVVNNRVCHKHGARKIFCKVDSCNNKSRINGLCHRHGAKRRICKIDSCNNLSRSNGVCFRHSAKR